MSASAKEPFSNEQLRLGPIEAIEVFTTTPPGDRPVAEALDTRTVPFEEIKDLIGRRPVDRAPIEPV